MKVDSYNAQDRKSGRLVYNFKYKKMNRKMLDIDAVENLIDTHGMGCYYCKITTRMNPKYRFDKKQFTLDRINNSDTHHRDNILICCWSCNSQRGNLYTVEEFLALKRKK